MFRRAILNEYKLGLGVDIRLYVLYICKRINTKAMTRIEKIGFVKGLSSYETALLLDSTDNEVMEQHAINLEQLKQCWLKAKELKGKYRGKSQAEWREILTNYQNRLV